MSDDRFDTLAGGEQHGDEQLMAGGDQTASDTLAGGEQRGADTLRAASSAAPASWSEVSSEAQTCSWPACRGALGRHERYARPSLARMRSQWTEHRGESRWLPQQRRPTYQRWPSRTNPRALAANCKACWSSSSICP